MDLAVWCRFKRQEEGRIPEVASWLGDFDELQVDMDSSSYKPHLLNKEELRAQLERIHSSAMKKGGAIFSHC